MVKEYKRNTSNIIFILKEKGGWKIKATNLILWFISLLIILSCFYLYAKTFGTPWEKHHQQSMMKEYLEEKYHADFVIVKTNYNALSESYQAYASPKKRTQLLFMVEQDQDAESNYTDTYPKVFWDSNISRRFKEKFLELFPNLDVPTLKALRISERGQYAGPHIPTYQEIHASPLACSITINIKKNWEQAELNKEKKYMVKLSEFLRKQHFPVLVEVRFYKQNLYNDEKVFFITEEGKIIER